MKVAVITGASSGMGREFVVQLEKYFDIDEVWVIARREDRLKSLQNILKKTKVKAIPLDLTLKESFDIFHALLEKEKPDIKLLINASGFGYFGHYENIPMDYEEKMVDLNVKAYMNMTKLCLPYMHEGSNIIQLDSLSAFQPVPYIGVYAATKAFVLSYSKSLYMELEPRKIRVLSVCPGWVKTEFFETASKTNDGSVRYFYKLFEPNDVVAKAYHDLLKTKKEVSVLGFGTRWQVRLVKFLPSKLVMKIWMRQQRKTKNNNF